MSRLSELAGGGLRLAALCSGILALVSFIGFHRAQASLRDILLDVGSEFMLYPGAPSDASRSLELNGGLVSFRSHTVDAPLEDVIRYYRSQCRARDAGLTERLNGLVRGRAPQPLATSILAPVATTSWVDPPRGYVACLDLGARPLDFLSLVERLERFVRSGRLGELGVGRYVYAESLGDGSRRSMVFTAWTEDLNLHDLIVSEGEDVPGFDLPRVPRPPGSQRILSSREVGGPSALAVYLSTSLDPDGIGGFYRRVFEAEHWDVLERTFNQKLRIGGSGVVAAQRDGNLVTVVARVDGEGRSVVTLLSSGVP